MHANTLHTTRRMATAKQSTAAAITGEDVVHASRWLRLKHVKYTTQAGEARIWDAAERTTRRPSAVADGVMVIAKVARGGKVVVPLVKQFRPPAAGYTLEFPAGLLEGDAASATVEDTALRELFEETGLRNAKIASVSPPLLLDPGMSNSRIVVVTATVDGDAEENAHATPHPVAGEGEEISVVRLHWEPARREIDAFAAEQVYLEDLTQAGLIALAAAVRHALAACD